jgi:hypothetical protein
MAGDLIKLGGRGPSTLGAEGERGPEAMAPNAKRRPLSAVPNTTPEARNIKKLPRISHKAAAN